MSNLVVMIIVFLYKSQDFLPNVDIGQMTSEVMNQRLLEPNLILTLFAGTFRENYNWFLKMMLASCNHSPFLRNFFKQGLTTNSTPMETGYTTQRDCGAWQRGHYIRSVHVWFIGAPSNCSDMHQGSAERGVCARGCECEWMRLCIQGGVVLKEGKGSYLGKVTEWKYIKEKKRNIRVAFGICGFCHLGLQGVDGGWGLGGVEGIGQVLLGKPCPHNPYPIHYPFINIKQAPFPLHTKCPFIHLI